MKRIRLLIASILIFCGCSSGSYNDDLSDKDFNEKIDKEYQDILLMMKDAEGKGSNYNNELEGKNRNEMADYLYSEGFRMELSSKYGALGEKYTKVITYPGNDLLQKSAVIFVYLWYSYGYTDLYYKVEYYYHYLNWIWVDPDWQYQNRDGKYVTYFSHS